MATAQVAVAFPGRQTRLRTVFGGLMLVVLLAALDQTIIATALPTIVGDLGGLEHLSWATSAFLLAQTVATPLYGKFGDLLGRKRVLQSAVVLFLIGSGLCGLSGSMTELIAFRAVQGLGAGGLIVLTQAVVGDIVPPRDRGRYQGLFGGVFGLATVAGPLLGGVLVQAISWRWVFYINLPLGLFALGVLQATLPPAAARGRPAIDYMGAGLLAGALTATVLATSLGGTTWPWGSAKVVAVSAAAVVLIAGFLAVERRAREPILPPALLRSGVFPVAGSLSLIVGFALFGAVTFLPLFFQTVNGASPTEAGLHLFPMMAGLVVMSVTSGQLIARRGRYRAFPIAGTAVMAVGLVLLSRLDVATGTAVAALFLFILGLGLGSVMQVLVLVVQNAVDYAVLGAATSGVTMLRGIGGSLGTAVFGTIFSNRLAAALSGAPGASAGSHAGAGLTGPEVTRLPPATRAVYEHAYVHALRPVFLVAAGAAVVGFALSWLLKERPLRETAAASQGLDDALAAPRSPDSLAEIQRALSMSTTLEQRRRFRAGVAARAQLELGPQAIWALLRFGDHGVPATLAMAGELGATPERVAAVIDELRRRGLVAGDDHELGLTPAGQRVTERVLATRRELLAERLADDTAARDPQVDALLRRLARELSDERP
jgi:EmrB/QacA subfamily drug resistance transporter